MQDRYGEPCRLYAILPEERAAICAFALEYPKIGYRKLTWMMVDAEVACVGESTVYRVLSEADLLARWKRSASSPGEYHFEPTAPNQQWHTYVMYVWVAARFYFLLSFVDAYSRYIVHHKLLLALNGQALAIEVHDRGSEFVNRDVAAVIKAHSLIDIKTRPRHPESNGIVERFATMTTETTYLKAETIIEKLIHHSNEERLHGHTRLYDARDLASW